MKLITRLIIVVILAIFSVNSAWAASGINRKINFQGKVVNKGVGATDGTNIADGNYNFTFTLWSTLAAGTSLWTETWNGSSAQVPVTSGIFQVALGTYATFPPSVNFNSDSLYVSVNFNGDGEMTPRIQMAAVPYAFNAEKVGGLTVTATDGTLSIGNSKTITFGDNFTTVVGVGISLNQNLSTGSTVQFAGLSIGGTVAFSNLPIGTGTTILYIGAGGNLVQGTLPAGGQAYTATNGLNLAGSAFGLGGTLTGNTQIGTSSFGLSFLGLGNSLGLSVGGSGYVGIGTSNPGAKLDVLTSDSLSTNSALNIVNSSAFTILQVLNSGGVGVNSSSNANWGLNVHSAYTGGANDYYGTYSIGSGTRTSAPNPNLAVGVFGRADVTTSNTQNWTDAIGLRGVWGSVNTAAGMTGTVTGAASIYSSATINAGTVSNLYGIYIASPTGAGTITSKYAFVSEANAGNVGIGTTAPSKKLDVAGDINLTGTIFSNGTSGTSGQILSSTGTGLSWINSTSVGTTYSFTNGLTNSSSTISLGGTLTGNTQIGTSSFGLSFLGLGNSQALFIGSSGYVGIGTTNPSRILTVSRPDAGTSGMLVGNASVMRIVNSDTSFALGRFSGLQFNIQNDADAQTLASIGTVITDNASSWAGDLVFGVKTNSSAQDITEYMRLKSGGNFGIGTTNPLYTLQIGGTGSLGVGGSVTFSNLPIGTGTTILYIGAGGNLVQGTLPAGGQAYTATNGLNLAGSAFGLGGTLTGNTQIGTSSFGLSFLGLGESQSLYLSPTGAVLIGTSTPYISHGLYVEVHDSVSAAGINAVNTLGDGRIEIQSDVDFSMISYGPYSSKPGVVSIETDEAYGDLRLEAIPDIPIKFFNNNTERMRINSGTGYIGIGTTNPLYKLEVAGDGMFSTKLGVGGTGTRSFNVVTDASIGTNLSIGGSLSLSAIATGVGTTVLFIDGAGNITSGTLPPGGYNQSKTIVLSPEFAGASLSADGSGTTAVSMTSDNTLNAASSGWKNYYQLSSTDANIQDYSVIVRVTLPSDFGTWETGSCPSPTCALEVNYQTGLGTTGDNLVAYIISNDTDTPATAVCSIGNTANTSWGQSGCTEATLNDNSAPEWDAAGETAVIRIKMAAKSTASALARVGDITLRYKSKF